jgi:RHH-type transcriptional regulator, rel operon repressor / antitoxin RelB
MSQNIVTIRLDASKKKALDVIASGLDRDRSYIINQAIDAFLDAHHWQFGHIKEGLRQASRKEFASDAEVKSAFAKWRK